MKNVSLISIISGLIIILGAGCSRNQPPVNTGLPTTTPPQAETTEPEQTAPSPITTTAKTLYRGAWFDIQYPENFSASPTSPTLIAENNDIRIQTDEAKFTSPDGAMEFFVYSPQWGGNPKEYLNIKATEELVSEETNITGEEMDKTTTRWTTVKAKDSSYYRSFVSIYQENVGSPTHNVFGIKYKDAAAYELYKNEYEQFKKSLRQYAD